MPILFIDTNCFIQLRDLKDLPWKELFARADKIDLLITPLVISELDRFKYSPKDRLRNRARQALKQIEDAAANGGVLNIRPGPIAINIVIASAERPAWDRFPQLDPGSTDSEIVARAASHREAASIFSCDTGPRIQAMLLGLNVHKPSEDWFLADVQSDEQRRIGELERELKKARETMPLVSANFVAQDTPISELSVRVPQLPPLGAKLVRCLADTHLQANPRFHFEPSVSFPGLPGFPVLGQVPQSGVDRNNADYDAYVERVSSFYRKLHERVAAAATVIPATYCIKNEGYVTAMGLTLDVLLEGDAEMLTKKDLEGSHVLPTLDPPTPPTRPRGRDSFGNDILRDLNFPAARAVKRPDPTAFYWLDPPGLTKGAKRQCDEFRATATLEDTLCVWTRNLDCFDGSLRLTISATNMSGPVKVNLPISLKTQPARWEDEDVVAMMPEELRAIFSEL